jgi:hypothetical protein
MIQTGSMGTGDAGYKFKDEFMICVLITVVFSDG